MVFSKESKKGNRLTTQTISSYKHHSSLLIFCHCDELKLWKNNFYKKYLSTIIIITPVILVPDYVAIERNMTELVKKGEKRGEKHLPLPRADFRIQRLFGVDRKHQPEVTVFQQLVTFQHKLSHASCKFWDDASLMLSHKIDGLNFSSVCYYYYWYFLEFRSLMHKIIR